MQDGYKHLSTKELNDLSREVIGAAISVHRELGPGLLESAYEACLAYELRSMGVIVEQQKPLPLQYRGVTLDCGYRLDLLLEGALIIEVKAIEQILPVHKAQLLSYLSLSGCRLGLLMNFNVEVLRTGIKRLVLKL